MRNLLVLSAAASVLALGISIQQAAALFPSATATGSEAFTQKVQQKGEEKGSGGVQGKDSGALTGGGQARGAVQK
jgi:hypothetical protein